MATSFSFGEPTRRPPSRDGLVSEAKVTSSSFTTCPGHRPFRRGQVTCAGTHENDTCRTWRARCDVVRRHFRQVARPRSLDAPGQRQTNAWNLFTL